MTLLCDHLDTPVGRLALVADDTGALHALGWPDPEPERDGRTDVGLARRIAAARPATDPHGLATTLSRYFAGDLAAIDAIRVVLAGTPFQVAVWTQLRAIVAGDPWSYGALARRIGRPSAVRAVGLANGANPIAIVVPCHRVIGSDGSLTGYGGGLTRKRWLLDHERRDLPLWRDP